MRRILAATLLLTVAQVAGADPRPIQPSTQPTPLHGVWNGLYGGEVGKSVDPDTAFTVEFTAPSGEKQTAAGYWLGRHQWGVRFRPDRVGTWTYRATSNPKVAGLDGETGRFEVVQPAAGNRFETHGPIRVAKSGTHLEHADGTPFFFLADTCWTGPALSDPEGWRKYCSDRASKGFTAVQFNTVSPWRTAPTDAEGRQSYTIENGTLRVNPDFYRRLDDRMDTIARTGLLAAPVLCWAHKKGDSGVELTEEQIIKLVKYEVARYGAYHVFWILAGDNRYTPAETERWKRIGRAVFGDRPAAPVTTHPTGRNWPWKGWEDAKWLTVLGYQSGHGDDAATWKWIHSGPPAEYGRRREFARPAINLEPPYEDHNGYQSKRPHTDYKVRQAVYWSLLAHPPAGVTYGGHGVWSWHTKPGKGPTDHESTGVAKVWSEALDLPGAKQMGYVRKLFESLPWTTLRPETEVFVQETGKDDPGKFVACAVGRGDGAAYVFYFPAGATADIRLHVRAVNGRGTRWFNPRTGEWTDKSARGLFTPPDEQDWVLVVKP